MHTARAAEGELVRPGRLVKRGRATDREFRLSQLAEAVDNAGAYGIIVVSPEAGLKHGVRSERLEAADSGLTLGGFRVMPDGRPLPIGENPTRFSAMGGAAGHRRRRVSPRRLARS